MKGQLIAVAKGVFSASVHAPSSGTVSAIEERPVPHPSGMSASCIVIDTDGEDRWIEHRGLEESEQRDVGLVVERLHQAGLVGLGGAGFPTAVKMTPPDGTTVHTLIINGTECEPYITADDALMRERSEEIIAGVQLLARTLGVSKVLIGIEDNKPESIRAMRSAASAGKFDVIGFPTKYPSGGEKQLIQILTGLEVPSGRLPADLGIVCLNVGTAFAAQRAIGHGEPLISRITTLTGEAIAQPQNVEVLLGTPMRYLLEFAGCKADSYATLIMGGPLMGFSLDTADIPVIKTTNCLLAPTATEIPPPAPAQPCIRCGLCAEVCPASLLPQQLYWYAQAKDIKQLEDHQLFDCIECGACAWVCPSNIPLVQYYRASKTVVRGHHEDHQRGELSRQRFETRQARLEQEQVEKEARRRERAARAVKAAEDRGEGADARTAMVQDAVERVKAKKLLAAGDQTEALAASIDRAAQKTIERQAAELAPLDTDDPAAQAIARALARRAQGADADRDPTEALHRIVDSARRKIGKLEQKLAEAKESNEASTVAILEKSLTSLQKKLAEAEAKLAESTVSGAHKR